MLNVTLTNEQVVSLIGQLPKNKKKELIDQLLFEEWLESAEGRKHLSEREEDFTKNKTLTLKEMRKKLRAHGKKV
jgi:hypothetical protein